MFSDFHADIKNFVNKDIKPSASQFDKQEFLPDDIIGKVAQKGLLGMTLPKEFGGLGLNPIEAGIITEEVGRGCCSVRSLLTVHLALVAQTVLRFGSKDQKKLWLPKLASGSEIAAFALSEPNVGSDAGKVNTTYKRRGNNYIINGIKKWITFGNKATVFLVACSGENGVATFLIKKNASGISTNPINGMLGNRASHTAEVKFDNVEISAENLLGKEGMGFNYIVNYALDQGRYSIAWAALAVAQEALSEMVSYASGREQFGQKISNFQLIKGLIGDAVTEIHAARALCNKAGQMRCENHIDAIMETNMAKYFASKVASKVTSSAVQVHGANGCNSSYAVERLYREAKIFEIIEGTSQIQQVMISEFGLSRYKN